MLDVYLFRHGETYCNNDGRHTGWLAAASSLAAGPDCNGPDLILLPECPFDEEAFLKRVAELEKERHNVIIAVSEGGTR